jgi:hypothetical protein
VFIAAGAGLVVSNEAMADGTSRFAACGPKITNGPRTTKIERTLPQIRRGLPAPTGFAKTPLGAGTADLSEAGLDRRSGQH